MEHRTNEFISFVMEKKSSDLDWLKEYEKIKDEEAINLFSDREVFIYFRIYLTPPYPELSKF